MNPKTYITACFFLFVVFAGLLTYKIADPWQYHHDDNGAWYSAAARTHLIRGLGVTKGQDFFLHKADGRLEPYLHHPPLLSLYLAAVFKLTGQDSPLIARSAIAFLHVLSFFLFFGIVNRLIENEWPRLWAIFVFAIVPMSVFFGKMPNHEPFAMCFLLAGYYCYLRYESAVSKGLWMFLAGLSWFLAAYSSWQAVLVVAGVSLYVFFCGKPQSRRFAVLSVVIVTLTSFAVVAQIIWARPQQPATGLKGAFDYWFLSPYLSRYFTNLYKGFKYCLRYCGYVPVIYACIWLVGLSIDLVKRKPGISKNHLFIASTSIGTLIFSLIFANILQGHAYMQFYYLPFYAMASALFVQNVFNRISAVNKTWGRAFVLASVFLTAGFSFHYFLDIYAGFDGHSLTTIRSFAETYY